MRNLIIITMILALTAGCKREHTFRIATFNVALSERDTTDIKLALESGKDQQLLFISETIQKIRPDIILLQEFDYDSLQRNINLFHSNYLVKSHNKSIPIRYPYILAFPSNTGIPSHIDLNNDGITDSPNDCFGYGKYPGQYAFCILSQFPIDLDHIRSFQHFLWKSMPNALLPQKEDGSSFLTPQALSIFRLSSKNHVDIPIIVNNKTIHILSSHPTPPIFDGTEELNKRRNHDEIRFWSDYITGGERSNYIFDDKGGKGGLSENSLFIIMGDMNADPHDGDSTDEAIKQLLDNPRINTNCSYGALVPTSQGATEQFYRNKRNGDIAHHTSTFGLRVDYVLPSSNITATKSGVFWPAKADKETYLTQKKLTSDHRLVWVDIEK